MSTLRYRANGDFWRIGDTRAYASQGQLRLDGDCPTQNLTPAGKPAPSGRPPCNPSKSPR